MELFAGREFDTVTLNFDKREFDYYCEWSPAWWSYSSIVLVTHLKQTTHCLHSSTTTSPKYCEFSISCGLVGSLVLHTVRVRDCENEDMRM